MVRLISLLFVAGLYLPSCLSAQKLKKADKAELANLEAEVQYLASDKLEGRRTGTPGEQLASAYIIEQFAAIKLEPKAEHGQWLQPFDVYDGKQVNDSTHFIVNNQPLQLQTDYFPLAFSAQKEVAAKLALALQESGVPWFIDLKEVLENTQSNPHFDWQAVLRAKVKESVKKGATAVVFYNSSPASDNVAFEPKDRSEAVSVPVIYLTIEGKRKYFKDEAATLDVKIAVSMSEKRREGHNVIGFLNNGAAHTVIIGAHYDHLGYGEDGNSLYRGTERLINHGADDNASGTAALIELARLLRQSKFRKSNYLFIAFSGEELGLFGSKYFTEHPTIDLSTVSYMINLDMVGRLNDSTHVLTIGGYGTSPTWGPLLNRMEAKAYFKFKFDSSGTGPSDYTSFYLKNIPVLFFFTGMHADYHRPSDVADKINYLGELQVVKFIDGVIGELNDSSKLAFTKTRENPMGTTARFTVTMGIMPDYTFNGTGVRLDAVSEGRPANKAGLKAGDVVVKLGDYSVSSLEDYMQALSKFKKGDKTKVYYKRGGNLAEAAVEF